MSSREPTLADVAELAGVSLTTVSRVLNNRGYLSEKTKKNVADAIETLGYRPNSLARALHGKRTQTVGLIVPAVSLPFFGELAVEVENALADAGYRILICNSMGRADREREYLSLLVGNRVDGIISGAHNEGLGEYDTIRMPLVTIDRELSPSIPNVRCANEEAGAMATRALIEGGCRHPLLLTSRSGPRNLREAGYRAEIERAGLTPRVVTVPFDTPTGCSRPTIWRPPRFSSGRARATCRSPLTCPSSALTERRRCAAPSPTWRRSASPSRTSPGLRCRSSSIRSRARHRVRRPTRPGLPTLRRSSSRAR